MVARVQGVPIALSASVNPSFCKARPNLVHFGYSLEDCYIDTRLPQGNSRTQTTDAPTNNERSAHNPLPH